MSETFDFGILGGGVIGLSLARELCNRGRVLVVDRQNVGQEASWAGAGILPPASAKNAIHSREKLLALSFQLHEAWAAELMQESGIDNGFRKCGAIHLARTPGELASLNGQLLELQEDGIQVTPLTAELAVKRVPSLAAIQHKILAAAWLPQEAQIRNPWHLQALKQSCINQGVQFLENQGHCQLRLQGSNVASVQTETGAEVSAKRFCVTAGAWTAELIAPLGIQISTVPVRGQMLLFKLPEPIFTPIIYEGTRYIVAREDGHVVVGSTLEEAGFDKSTSESGVKSLLNFANGIVPELNESNLVQSWAGLRPASFDGFPYMGAAPHLDNLWIATAHFRSGLLLSTGTAKLMSQILCHETPLFDLSPFRIDRG